MKFNYTPPMHNPSHIWANNKPSPPHTDPKKRLVFGLLFFRKETSLIFNSVKLKIG